MAPIKLGLIGLSAQGSWASQAHLPYLQKTKLYHINALLNSSTESAVKAAREYGLAEDVSCHSDIDSLIHDPNVDVVVVSVKAPDHYKLAKPALQAGKDVFVEWPLGANLKEAEELAALATLHKVKTMVGLQARQSPSVRKAREMIQNDDLGEILGTTMLGSGIIFGPTTPFDFEYGCQIERGANLITIPAGHAMDALCYVLGEFKDLQATLANNRPKMPLVDGSGQVVRTAEKTSHDYVSVQGNLVRGGVATVVYQGGFSRTEKNFYWEINGTKGSLVLEGPVGHLQMYQPKLRFVKAHQGAQLEEVDVEKAENFAYNVGKAWDSFAEQGEGTVTTFEEALVRHKMIDAIYRSNKKGTRESYI
ncbi:hypothetical protein CLAIMM_00099 [Cladophialophora immunda]|nr:hypothetical protein CLAIMM_00099 [Cladophialophora immunda]